MQEQVTIRRSAVVISVSGAIPKNALKAVRLEASP
jgi:hypothetical protein